MMKELNISSRLSLILTEQTRQAERKSRSTKVRKNRKVRENVLLKYGEIDRLYMTKLRVIEGLKSSTGQEDSILSLESSCLILEALILFIEDYDGKSN